MAGKGPAGKPAGTRQRRNASPVAERVFEFIPGEQPELPEYMPGESREDGTGFPWPAATRTWWAMWAEHPSAKEFSDSDWLFLMDTAVLHGAYWSGDFKQAPELRLRVAKFGATPEDRVRLRMQFAVADKAEAEAQRGKPPAESGRKGGRPKKKVDPRANLTVVS